MISEEAENVLREVWMSEEVGKEVDAASFDAKTIDELKKEGLVEIKNGKLAFTHEGKKRAEKIVRLHRLAERLLSDILGIKEVEEHACRFEHLIDDEAEEAICTLLGQSSDLPSWQSDSIGEMLY